MTQPRFKIKAQQAEEILARFQPSDAAKAVLARASDPQGFAGELIKARAYDDLVWFLAHGLPKREAVWWAALCARSAVSADPKLAKLELGAVESAEAWVKKPSEETRRQAEGASLAAPETHASRWAAAAAFWSGGSLAPPGAPDAPAPEELTAKAVASAVLMAAAADPSVLDPMKERFCRSGLNIAEGGAGHLAEPAAQ